MEPLRCLLPAGEFGVFATLLAGMAEANAETRGCRLQRVETWAVCAGADVWYFLRTGESISATTLEAMRNAGIGSLNLVSVPYCGGQRWRWLHHGDTRPETTDLTCDPAGFGLPVTRWFRTTLTIADAPPEDAAQEGLLHFLATLFDLKTEIQERVPDYFEHRSLRVFAPENVPINLLYVSQAAKMILAIAANTTGGDFAIMASETIDFEDLLDRIGMIYDVSLLTEPNGGREDQNSDGDLAPQTALDDLFDRRLMKFGALLADLGTDAGSASAEASLRAARLQPADARVTMECLETLLQATFRRQRQDHDAMLAQATAISGAMSNRHVQRAEQTLPYSSIGSGAETLVLLNALGQGPEVWYRLIAQLRHRFRILLWDLCGLNNGDDRTSIAGHADDLGAILERENVENCHLIAWCTGPKIAVDFALRHPGKVCSMTFLNTTLKCNGSPPELDTVYEQSFDSLCQVLDRRPSMAASIAASLSSGGTAAEADFLEDADERDISRDLLATMNRELRGHVLRPFQSPETVINYGRQLLDFWSYDMRQFAGEITVPVLLLASEYDSIATPEASESAATLFPRSRLLRAHGATHYFLFDRADVVARMIESFVGAQGKTGANGDMETRAQDNWP